MTWPTERGDFQLGDFALQSGEVLRGAHLSWKTHGTLSPNRDNVLLFPTSYSALHSELEWAIGPASELNGILDPTRWFIIQPDMFGNSLSSSPSNTPDYPALVTSLDNVTAQHRLLTERFGIDRIACVFGWSMGAQQAYHWAALFPDMVERAIAICGSAKTAVHNKVFLSGLLATLEAAPEYIGGGRFSAKPVKTQKAFGRIYAGWALSQDFYRAGRHLATAPDLETFLVTQWEDRWLQRDAANLYAQACTWFNGDISNNALYGGDLAKALSAIQAKVLLMPGETDLYFRVADNEAELPHLKQGKLLPIPSINGHRAGNPMGLAEDTAFLKKAVREWLAA